MSPTTHSFRTIMPTYRPQATLTTIKRHIVTLRIHHDKISFACVDDGFEEKVDQLGHGNSPHCYEGDPIALLHITEPETDDYQARMYHRMSTLHVILSDGNIIRRPEPNKSQRTVLDPVDRVYRAIMGAILTHCDDDHVLDTRNLREARNSTSIHTGQQSTKFVFNRHELLRMFYAIQARHADIQSLGETKIYSLRAYTAEEISELLDATYSRGRTFSLDRVSDAHKQAYNQSIRPSEIRSHNSDRSPHKGLMLLAHAANVVEEEDRKRDLFWD